MKKLAHQIELALLIPEADKEIAKLCIELLKSTVTRLGYSDDLLNKMYLPFKENTGASTESFKKDSPAIFRYKENIKKTFSEIKYMVLKSIGQFVYFDSDTKAHEMNESLKELSQDLENLVVEVLDVMDDVEDPNFQTNIIKGMDSIKQQTTSVVELIEDRIIDYLEDNILNTNWFNKSKSDIQLELNEKIPNLTKLYRDQGAEPDGIADKDLRGNVTQMEIQPTPLQKPNRDEVKAMNEGGTI